MSNQLTNGEFETLARFPRVAEQFCKFIDNSDCVERSEFVATLTVYLASLCEIGAQLPSVEPATDGIDFSEEEIKAHSEECFKLSNSLRRKFGALDRYWEIFDPLAKGNRLRVLCPTMSQRFTST